MRLWPRSLLGRNVLLLVALIVIGQLIAGIVFRQFVQRPFVERLADRLATNLVAIESGLKGLSPMAREQFVATFNAVSNQQASRQEVGRLVLPAERMLMRRASEVLNEKGIEVTWRRDPGGVFFVRLNVDQDTYWLYTPGFEATMQLPRAALFSWLAGMLLAFLGAYLIQRRINRPLAQLVKASQAIGQGRSVSPLAEQGPKEIADVCRSFNQMQQQLVEQEKQRELMLAGVTHDLRTPLTKMRLATEMVAAQADATYIDSMVRSCNQIDAIIGQFTDFAGVGSSEDPQPVDVNELIREVVDDAEAPFALDLDDCPPLALRRRAFKRLLLNLIENAERYASPPFEISTACAAGELVLQVKDRGPGIEQSQLANIMRPFFRGNEARGGPPGSGLGLAIASRIVHLEQGHIDLALREGGGLCVRVSLPLPARVGDQSIV